MSSRIVSFTIYIENRLTQSHTILIKKLMASVLLNFSCSPWWLNVSLTFTRLNKVVKWISGLPRSSLELLRIQLQQKNHVWFCDKLENTEHLSTVDGCSLSWRICDVSPASNWIRSPCTGIKTYGWMIAIVLSDFYFTPTIILFQSTYSTWSMNMKSFDVGKMESIILNMQKKTIFSLW